MNKEGLNLKIIQKIERCEKKCYSNEYKQTKMEYFTKLNE